jgi:hypothetical protein
VQLCSWRLFVERSEDQTYRHPLFARGAAVAMDCYRLLHTLEAWVTGYRSEHYKLGLQQAICFALALLPIVVNKLYLTLDRGGSSLYTAITVSATLLPPPVPPPVPPLPLRAAVL